MRERWTDRGKSVEVPLSRHEPYEPPLLTVLGSFRELTAGESQGGFPDDSGKTWA